LAEGVARERLVYFNFEDERLGELEAADLGNILDEYYRSYPEFRRRERIDRKLLFGEENP
jgi:predicted AAA+ superfamily ATPase